MKSSEYEKNKRRKYDKKPTLGEWKQQERVRRLHKTAKNNPKLLSEAQKYTSGSVKDVYSYVDKAGFKKRMDAKKKKSK